jgi:hypothetical protein
LLKQFYKKIFYPSYVSPLREGVIHYRHIT